MIRFIPMLLLLFSCSIPVQESTDLDCSLNAVLTANHQGNAFITITNKEGYYDQYFISDQDFSLTLPYSEKLYRMDASGKVRDADFSISFGIECSGEICTAVVTEDRPVFWINEGGKLKCFNVD